jgi:hypothetical protein
MKISELSDDQKSHLAYRLDHNTCCGYLTAGRIARGEFGDMEVVDVFLKADRTLRSAQVLARKVEQFTINPRVKEIMDEMVHHKVAITTLCYELERMGEVKLANKVRKQKCG